LKFYILVLKRFYILQIIFLIGEKLKILVSNDDGIDSLGIQVLVETLKTIADVTVVAPLKEQSAMGHAITMKTPLRVIKYYKNGEFFGYAVDGTPADCVKMGIRNIMETPPNIVISGINHGSNTAVNTVYSGTVSAAREAAIMDVQAIAVSVTSHTATKFEYAAKICKLLAYKLLSEPLVRGTFLNVNVPDLDEKDVKGIVFTKQGKSKWDDIYEKRQDPYGRDYYWLTGNLVVSDVEPDTDQGAINNNYVSITPHHFDSTDYKTYEVIRNWKI
jgi:5'-nucleotidase